MSLTRRRRGAFFDEIELHRELTDFALEGRDLGLVVNHHRGLDFLARQLAVVELRQPELDEVGRQAVLLLRIATTELAGTDVLA